MTFVVYDWPNNVCGPATWISRLLPDLHRFGITPRCLVMCWEQTGPLLAALQNSGVECESILCEGSTESRIDWIINQLADHPAHVFVPNLVVPALHAAAIVRQSGISTVGVLHSDDSFYRAVCDVFATGRKSDALTDLVCVSRQIEEQTTRMNVVNTAIHRIPYGVPIPKSVVRNSKGGLRIAYVGRLAEEQKRISEVTRALCRASIEIPGTMATIFGDGPDRHNVERILSENKPSSNVKLAGRVDNVEIQDKLLDFDVIVLLSDYEGLPIAILEAMACGVVPVCLQMNSGIPELVEHNVNGLVVSNRKDSFVDAIRKLHDDRLLLKRLSIAARARIENENSVAINTQRWSDMLKRITDGKTTTKSLKRPLQYNLPAVHPSLAAEDYRAAERHFLLRLYSCSRRLTGKLKKKIIRLTNERQGQ